MDQITEKDIDRLLQQLDSDAEKGGYHLNSRQEDTRALIQGLLINENRYGYWACPCREASGIKEEDLDIICPCDYRDPDLHDYDACFCGLYVSTAVLSGEKKVKPVPERRPENREMPLNNNTAEKSGAGEESQSGSALKYPVWRCKVCGYLCAREYPPESCPVCRAKKERFEVFMR